MSGSSDCLAFLSSHDGFPEQNRGNTRDVLYRRQDIGRQYLERVADWISLLTSGCLVSIAQGAMAGHAYKSAVDELDNGVGRDLDAPFRATVLEPVGKLCSYYPTINEAIAKRNKKVSRIRLLTWYFAF